MLLPLAIAVLAAFAACSSSRKEKPADGGGPDLGPDAARPPSDGPAGPFRSEYRDPEPFIFPQATREGVFYHPYFTRNAEAATDLSDPTALTCDRDANKCFFAAGHEYFSFPADGETLNSPDPIPLTVEADFSAEVDGQTDRIVDILVNGSNIYALVDGENPGIAMKKKGEAGEFFSFDALAPYPVSCPTDLTLFEDQILMSAANCREENFAAGALFVLNADLSGRMEPSGEGPYRTTQKVPKQVAIWRLPPIPLSDELLSFPETLIAVANRGTQGDSGIDFFEPGQDSREALANTPLEEAHAGQMLITGDRMAAFLSSEERPWLFVNDLYWSAIHLGAGDLDEAPLASAENPVRLFPEGPSSEDNSIVSFAYDEEREIFAASTSNARLFLLGGGILPASDGILFSGGFGVIEGHYFCNGFETDGCGPVAFLEHGAVALTQTPLGVTYLPHARRMD